MKIGLWIVIFLLAGSCVCSAAHWGGFRGTVIDGTTDYSDEAFAPLEQLASKVATGDLNDPEFVELYVKALMGLMQPNGPLKGVRIVLRSDDVSIEYQVTSDEDGDFLFYNLPMGEYSVTVYKGGKESDAFGQMSWRLKIEDNYRYARSEISFPSEFVTVKGRVADSSGKPRVGIHISAEEYSYNGELSRWSPMAHTVKAVTDEEGRYELPGLHPTPMWPGSGMQSGYFLRVEGENVAPCIRKIDVVTKETHAARLRWWKLMMSAASAEIRARQKKVDWPVPADAHGVLAGVDFRMTTASTLGGCVRDAAGETIPKARVWLNFKDKGPYFPLPPRPDRERIYTDANGRFSFSGLATGRYTVVVSVSNRSLKFPELPLKLREGEARTNLDLCYEVPPTGRIEASICEMGSDRAIGVYTAYVGRVSSLPKSGPSHGKLQKCQDKPGTFVVENVSPGVVQFRVSAPGYVFQKVSCEVKSGETTLLSIELEQAGTALVRVTRNGVVAPPYQMLAFPDGYTNAIWWQRTTNADGFCIFPGLKPGRCRLRVQIPEGLFTRYALVPAQIEAGKTNSVDIEMEGPCSFDLDLSFSTNASVRVRMEPADAPETEAFGEKIETCLYLRAYESRRFTITNQFAGEYRIGVQQLEFLKSGRDIPMKADQMKPILLEPGEKPVVSFEF